MYVCTTGISCLSQWIYGIRELASATSWFQPIRAQYLNLIITSHRCSGRTKTPGSVSFSSSGPTKSLKYFHEILYQSHYIRGVVGKYLEHVSVSDGQLSSPGYRNLGLTWEISISKLMQDICSLIPKYKNTSRIKVIPMPTLVNILTPKNASINWTQIISFFRRWQ